MDVGIFVIAACTIMRRLRVYTCRFWPFREKKSCCYEVLVWVLLSGFPVELGLLLPTDENCLIHGMKPPNDQAPRIKLADALLPLHHFMPFTVAIVECHNM